MDEKKIDGVVEGLMNLPRNMHERIKMNTELINMLNLQVERLVKLIAGLHDIDLDKVRGLESTTKRDET